MIDRIRQALVAAAVASVRAYPGSTKVVALLIGKNSTTLANELLEAGSAKLGLCDAVHIAVATQNPAILNVFAEAMDCYVLPKARQITGQDPMYLLSQLGRSFGGVVEAESLALSKIKPTRTQMDDIERRWAEHVAIGQELIAGIRAMHEGPKRHEGSGHE